MLLGQTVLDNCSGVCYNGDGEGTPAPAENTVNAESYAQRTRPTSDGSRTIGFEVQVPQAFAPGKIVGRLYLVEMAPA